MSDSQNDAREALLKRIADMAADVDYASQLKDLAEAYAYVVSPGQAHGSSVRVTH